jgi:hypothetical protein
MAPPQEDAQDRDAAAVEAGAADDGHGKAADQPGVACFEGIQKGSRLKIQDLTTF